jgi:hypothetical protein
VTSKVICPANCNGGYAERVKAVSPPEVGITPEIARAAKLSSNEKLSTCWHCDCVWRTVLDMHSLRERKEILGWYEGVTFRPEPWLERAIADSNKQT